ncbi:MAG: nuclear transport factor 2 family protein [Flavobacteriales bacterium CG03_land_8_20_14_0_80_35_15]|nr:nuclear transport factor 2 family protein [Zetaproteobacteria bacterium]OIO09543.1 MAG: limonene-1,2-epoxide hydrolase [Flavobacteriaceae bacterium CG1_02_35_72]PIR12393.1 MAG: limonene-1,2-epoxide hydrolase [Flavobacteriales bacterium CG11_big_fil_rev_8_21_14_0_20_35_7]PIV16350.1 MAG: nuclear transport factor 2 family protein [Flavobacteriales bacterium CG03_land_8_20_14_0_80_35_15]PIX06391.1 MAG: nuclear transport factor 2 family protein [Flavobacteriales bacterium CG_4_8_14_3_um_filter_35
MKTIIEKFYTAFKNLDSETMAACYHRDIVFNDPAFGVLNGDHAKNMWRMLCANQKGKNFKITFAAILFVDKIGSAHWEAFYTFSKTRRHVHNIIEAKFEFRDGLIIKHTDNFNLYRWSKQAFGVSGYLLGWTSFFKKKLQNQTNAMLTKFEENLD